MTTIKDLIKWLDKFPPEAEVEFGMQEPAGDYQSYGSVEFISPVLDNLYSGDGWEFSDFRNNQFVKKGDKHFGKCYLQIGEGC